MQSFNNIISGSFSYRTNRVFDLAFKRCFTFCVNILLLDFELCKKNGQIFACVLTPKENPRSSHWKHIYTENPLTYALTHISITVYSFINNINCCILFLFFNRHIVYYYAEGTIDIHSRVRQLSFLVSLILVNSKKMVRQ